MGQLPQRLLERSCLLIYIHRAQQTNSVKQLLHKNKTVLINIPGAATSIYSTNTLHVRELFEKHIDENLEAFVEGKLCCKKTNFHN